MVEGNKAWWEFPKWTHEYEKGVDDYIEKAFAIKSQGNQIRCPCIICHFRYWQHRNVVRDHLICNGFLPKEDDLSQLGVENQRDYVFESGETSNVNDGIEELLANTMREGPNEDAKKFLHLVEEGQQELYPGCKNFSRLSFIIRLFTYKCDYKLSNVAFSALLEILREVLPEEAKLPKSFYETNKVIKLLGLDYQKIDACPNDCMLYWEEFADATSCHVCGSPRWESKDEDND